MSVGDEDELRDRQPRGEQPDGNRRGGDHEHGVEDVVARDDASGEKAGLNGVLNFSVLDGWWREGYNGENGWAIGGDADYDDLEAQDAADAEVLFDTLEQSVVPLYYDIDVRTGVPTGWMRMVKESIRTIAPMFSTARMLKEYTAEMYVPAATGQIVEA